MQYGQLKRREFISLLGGDSSVAACGAGHRSQERMRIYRMRRIAIGRSLRATYRVLRPVCAAAQRGKFDRVAGRDHQPGLPVPASSAKTLRQPLRRQR